MPNNYLKLHGLLFVFFDDTDRGECRLVKDRIDRERKTYEARRVASPFMEGSPFRVAFWRRPTIPIDASVPPVHTD
jgi:hypothetical protein